MNVVHLIGHLGRDPAERAFPNGDRVASFALATHKRLPPGADGQRRERTDWHRIRVYGPPEGGLVDVVLTYARKGSRLRITGELTTGSLIDDDGNRVNLTFIDVRPGSGDLELLDPPRRHDARGDDPDAPADAGRPAPGRRRDPFELRDGIIGDDLA